MAGSGRKNADNLLILALASGKSVPEAAATSGVSERTVYRRLDDPTFKKKIQALQAEMVGQVLGRMVDGMNDAVDVLRTLMDAKSESVALGASRTLIEPGVKLRETVEFESRLAALEARNSKQANHEAAQPIETS